jgi:GTP diphosphokinase / guanosine-3',5'-bis(diphosphate) 3'-diphosphatase
LSPCCSPIDGDDVFGYITINEGIKVHRKDCPNAIALQSRYGNRIIKATWISSDVVEFTANLVIKGIDTVGLVNRITQLISHDLDVNIRSININGDAGIFEGSIVVVVRNRVHLQNIINEIKKIEGIKSVERYLKNA